MIFIGIALGILSAVIGQRAERSRAELPGNPIVLRAVSGAAAVMAIALFVAGFWTAWYAPFLGFGAGIAAIILWDRFLAPRIEAPLASIAAGIASLFLGQPTSCDHQLV